MPSKHYVYFSRLDGISNNVYKGEPIMTRTILIAILILAAHPTQAAPRERHVPVWTLAPTAMAWKDANEYCRSVGAHLPSLDELNELDNTADMMQLARLQIGGSIWSSGIAGRGTHYIVAPMQNTMMPWDDIGRNSTACVK